MSVEDSPRAPAAPFIVTAELPVDIFSWANSLRVQHFPPERNKLKAHVTLFHSFAPSLREELRSVLSRLAGLYAPPEARCEGLMDLGKGTALAIQSPGMLEVRGAIAEHFHGAQTAQDKHEPRLHITVQNKVTPQEAKALQRALSQSLRPRPFRFTGLGLHLYRETHWEEMGIWKFRGKQHS
jgi:hypothetical protein